MGVTKEGPVESTSLRNRMWVTYWSVVEFGAGFAGFISVNLDNKGVVFSLRPYLEIIFKKSLQSLSERNWWRRTMLLTVSMSLANKRNPAQI